MGLTRFEGFTGSKIADAEWFGTDLTVPVNQPINDAIRLVVHGRGPTATEFEYTLDSGTTWNDVEENKTFPAESGFEFSFLAEKGDNINIRAKATVVWSFIRLYWAEQ